MLGAKLKRLRLRRGKLAVWVCASLQRRGWDVSPSVYCHLESGNRMLTDVELLLILKVLKGRLSDLE